MIITHNNICRRFFVNISLSFWIVVNRTLNYRKHNSVKGIIACFSQERGGHPIGYPHFSSGDPYRLSLLRSPDQEPNVLLAVRNFTFYRLHIALVG